MAEQGRKPRNVEVRQTQPSKARAGLPKTVLVQKDKGSKRLIFRRTGFLMFLCGFFMFLPLFWQLWDLAVVNHDKYGGMAASQQTKSVSMSANRGNIYDSQGNTLAMSATVYKLILSPLDLLIKINERDYRDSDGIVNEIAYQNAIIERKQTLAQGLAQLFPEQLTTESILERMERDYSQYEVLLTNIEEDDAVLVREFLAFHNCGYDLWLTPDSKRYYPYSSLASGILGFVNDNGGAYGIEAAYETNLQGMEGRIVTAKTGRGTELYNSFSSFDDAINGNNIHLTIDATIQSYAERTLAEGIQAYDIEKGGFCIILDPNTGEVLAAASSPTYDLNSYSEIIDPKLQAYVTSETNRLVSANSGATDKSYDEIVAESRAIATSTARETMWKSLTFQDTYEPGSTFKALILAACLEEGLVSESDTFYCSGSCTIAGETIRCSNTSGHNMQTLAQAVENSCNPAFMDMGERLGIDLFYKYFEAFGLKDSTGIDLNGEYLGIMWEKSAMTVVDLAVGSFGQRFTVNPLQMVTAFAATINGGHLMEPYVVSSISDDTGTVIEAKQPTVVRQVVSQESSDRTRAILESVVENGSGKNARVAGYSVGGKTGTSETLVDDEVTVSFIGFAPVEDPQIIVLLAFNAPNRVSTGSSYSTTGVYISGGNMAALSAGSLISDVLDYLGVKKDYSSDEILMAEVTVPRVTDLELEEGIEILNSKLLNYRTVGEGDIITSQVPARGAIISGNSTVILYLGDSVPEANTTVPNLYGMTYANAKATLEARGLFLTTSAYVDASSTISSQSIASGTVANLGTVINANFTAPSVQGD